jgi:2'-5' RNA ligase
MSPSNREDPPLEPKRDLLRLFVAAPMWGTFREEALPRYEELRRFHWPLRWTRPENWHFTIQFLGDTPASEVENLDAALRKAVEGFEAFEIEVGGLGGFPRLSKARVLWVGVRKGAESLRRLAEAVRKSLAEAGHAGDKKQFEAHLTVARAREEPVQIQVPADIHAAHWGSCWVDSVMLVKSDLEKGGPVYTSLATVPLPRNSTAGS